MKINFKQTTQNLLALLLLSCAISAHADREFTDQLGRQITVLDILILPTTYAIE